MADDEATTVRPVTFRENHLVRLRGFNHAALDGKLVQVRYFDESTCKFGVVFLDDQARPPIPVIPRRVMKIKPEHFTHA